jgi:hypothetical protein
MVGIADVAAAEYGVDDMLLLIGLETTGDDFGRTAGEAFGAEGRVCEIEKAMVKSSSSFLAVISTSPPLSPVLESSQPHSSSSSGLERARGTLMKQKKHTVSKAHIIDKHNIKSANNEHDKLTFLTCCRLIDW